ncbi:DUF7685 domain-containing protein [Metabacillus halosaccharovorans]|uniref:DUF7685 domain-containing protein n=1 Tax=Metabacillus halosaccharovorans TaxID=930124 RepID=UPI00403DBDC9
MNNCDHCESNEVKVHFNSEESSMNLCSNCYNELMSTELEVEIEPLIEPFSLKDYQGSSEGDCT